MHREQIKELALANGFKLKPQPDGGEDLNPYVYEFAEALVDTLLPKAQPGNFEPPRMVEIFNLPVRSESWQDSDDTCDQCFDANGKVVFESFHDSDGWVEAATYAINNHDSMRAANLELARQLEAFGEEVEQLRKDKKRIDAIEANYWDVRYLGDAGEDVSIEIIGHFMAEPCERVVGEDYCEDLRAAIDQAMTADAYPPARPEYEDDDKECNDEA